MPDSVDESRLGFELRQAVREFVGFGHGSDLVDDVDEEPLAESGCFDFGEYQLVGHGRVTNDSCGRFSSFFGCVRTELHGLFRLDGKSFKGKVFVKATFHSCDKPSCPICFKYGWASREAMKVELRLKEASRSFGLVEHVIASVPVRSYGLSFEGLRSEAVKAVYARGVVGGCMIFHGARYNLRKHWYWSPHFHVLGFVLHGYGCRDCRKVCFKGCGGFMDRSYRANEKDGWIVKVAADEYGVEGKRESVRCTAWYQLNHATIKKGVVRFHVATWFGVCSYRKLKVTVEVRKKICPICQHDCVKLKYFGGERFLLDKGERECRRGFVADLEEGGRPVWVVDTRFDGG